jgi:anhydro-N-acetylmuramic acid kinase
MWALGLMSGTSLDGIDVALLQTDGYGIRSAGPGRTYPYEEAFRDELRGIIGKRADASAVRRVERRLTLHHAEAVAAFLATEGAAAASIDVVGFHGHTLLHDPARRHTVQIGDGALLAERTGIDVVNDFRAADVAAGGQGAPLASLFHAALARDLDGPIAVVNIGGVANVTWIDGDPDAGGRILAFDTGPGNALLDDWARRHTGRPMDIDGALAGAGRVDAGRVADMLADAYFDRAPPKSLDRQDFTRKAWRSVHGLGAEDGAATLAAFTAGAIRRAAAHFPAPPRRWLICGGGRRNPVLMAALGEALDVSCEPVEAVGWDGDALEAEAFAFLAVRSLYGLPLSLPTTTGAPHPLTGGVVHKGRRKGKGDDMNAGDGGRLGL